jgi:hypothetical protein
MYTAFSGSLAGPWGRLWQVQELLTLTPEKNRQAEAGTLSIFVAPIVVFTRRISFFKDM